MQLNGFDVIDGRSMKISNIFNIDKVNLYIIHKSNQLSHPTSSNEKESNIPTQYKIKPFDLIIFKKKTIARLVCLRSSYNHRKP